MSLEVFGVGFGRTGTESLKKAIETLNFGPCYHMFEVLPRPDRVASWIDLVQGKTPDWDKSFEGYNASVDWPGAYFWKEIAAHNPNAKLILSIRDADAWYESMSKTILPLLKMSSEDPNGLANQMFIERQFAGNIEDRAHVIDIYNRHNEAVKAAFGPDRLLVYELGSGWEPLCEFLGVNVPDIAYPRGNSSEEFGANIQRLAEANAAQGGTDAPGVDTHAA